jgi:hypothetical protein
MSHYTIEKDDSENLIIIDSGPLTRVNIVNLRWGINATGHAKLNIVDDYDEFFGIDLALARATERLSRKVQHAMIKSLGD